MVAITLPQVTIHDYALLPSFLQLRWLGIYGSRAFNTPRTHNPRQSKGLQPPYVFLYATPFSFFFLPAPAGPPAPVGPSAPDADSQPSWCSCGRSVHTCLCLLSQSFLTVSVYVNHEIQCLHKLVKHLLMHLSTMSCMYKLRQASILQGSPRIIVLKSQTNWKVKLSVSI